MHFDQDCTKVYLKKEKLTLYIFNLGEGWMCQKLFQELLTAIGNQKGNFEMEFVLHLQQFKKEKRKSERKQSS